ncbi:MAG: hypothetical protein JWO41_126 [Candidatus Saccharibacteria bacterium]|nr:hypothetical protein [Candidatus Saccharibacteria bacterium]
MHMLWVRRFFVQIFSSLLLLCLLLLALSFSITHAFSKPATLESWLLQSHLYDHFIDNIISQSSKSAGSTNGNQPNTAVIQAAAKQAFTPDIIQQSVNTFINSNFDWLEGNTKAPNFNIDLTATKQTFAYQAGVYTQQYLQTLPACTAAQAAQYNADTDPLTLTCLPSAIKPTQAALKIQEKFATSQDFLSNPVITADTLTQQNGGQPYYVKFDKAPQVYRLSKMLPYVLIGLLAVLAVLIYYVSPWRRKGIRRLGFIFLDAGILLIATKFAADFVLTKVEAQAFNNSNVGALQQSLSAFFGRAESGIIGVTLWFGIGYAVIGLAVLVALFVTRGRKPKQRKTTPLLDETPEAPEVSEQPAPPKAPLVTDIAPRPRAQPSGPPAVKPEVKERKKPRLVQL